MTHTQTDDRGRRSRKETEASANARRRKDRGGVIGKRLGVAESSLDFKNFAYRWVNDTPARIYTMTKEDDWEIVMQDGTELKDDSDMNAAVSHVVGTNREGNRMNAYLCRKPIAYYNADRDERIAALARELEELKLGNDRSGKALSDYVPSTGISI